MTQQSQFLSVTTCEEAHRLFRSGIKIEPLDSERISTAHALGRVVSVPVVAEHSVPGFDRSNFDGFAVRSLDTTGASEDRPVQLRLLNEVIPAGHQPTTTVEKGQAISISTGGMIPRGADAVCLVEHTQLQTSDHHSHVVLTRSVYPGSGISFAGSDIAQGETVLRSGQLITSRETGVLAAIGATFVEVIRKPKVAVISTGNEIIAPGESIQPGQVFDSNARIIADAVKELGGEPLELGIAVDQLDELQRRVDQALSMADIVLLSGGTSKGEGDLSYQVVSRYQDPGILVHGVALKPGKPICLAATQGKPLVVLPGFPTSAIFTFHEFIAPLIRQLAGLGENDARNQISAKLSQRVNSEIGRTEFLLVSLLDRTSHSENETESEFLPSNAEKDKYKSLPQAYPMGKGSGSVTTFSRADGFITIDRQTEIVDEGEVVEVQLIGQKTRPADLVVMGSHCQKLDLILNELQSAGLQIKIFSIGSTAGIHAAKRGDCDLAGIHLYDKATGQYNLPFATPEVEIVKGYSRTQGLVFRQNDQRLNRDEDQSIEQIVSRIAENPDLLMMNRNQGSGTRILIDRILNGLQPPGYAIQASNHHAVCAAIKQGRADWGIAIEAVAKNHDLGFLPIENEQFDFAIPKSRMDRGPVKLFRKVLNEFQD